MGLSALGAANISGEYNQKSADKANKTTMKMQGRDMRFQKEMRATMYQDMVKDLQAAGLNPILAYQKQGIGGSASGGSASAASLNVPEFSNFNPMDIFSAKQMSSDADLKDANKDLTTTNEKLQKEKTNSEKLNQEKLKKEIDLLDKRNTRQDIPDRVIKGMNLQNATSNAAKTVKDAGYDFYSNVLDKAHSAKEFVDKAPERRKKTEKFFDDLQYFLDPRGKDFFEIVPFGERK